MSIQKALSRIQHDLKAPKGQRNNFGKYNYRSTEDILSAVKPLLGECSLVLSDGLVELSGGVYVEATASLMLGEQIISSRGYAREAESQAGMAPAQITGSSSSYARKYALNGLFAIDDTKDDDATNTHGVTPSKPNQPKPKITPEQTVQILDLASKAGLSAENLKKAKDFANNSDTTEEGASAFIKKLQGMVEKNPAQKKTPKEKLIDDIILTAMDVWEQTDEDYVVSNLIMKLKVNSLSNATINDMQELMNKIKDGTAVPF